MNSELLISIVNPVIYVPIIYVLIKHYNCRVITTNVMISLQIKLFMQNKAKFRKSQMNVINVITKEYEKKDTWWSEKKQSQTKPNKANLQNAQTNVNKVSTKNYEHILNWVIYENKAKQSQFQRQKMQLHGHIAASEH